VLVDGVMVTSNTRRCHNTLAILITYAIRLHTIAKMAKMVKGLRPLQNARNVKVSMVEGIVRQSKCCSSRQRCVLTADFVLKPIPD
jgi:hypothetical protein